MSARRRILMLPERTFPSDHAMLDAVYARILPARGHQVRWLMRRGAGAPDASEARWRETPVQLVPDLVAARRWEQPLVFARRVRQTLTAAGRILREHPADIVQVRNDVADACAAMALRRRFGARFVFQLSFPNVEANTQRLDAPSLGRQALRRGKAVVMGRLLRWVMRQADLVLAISERMRDDLVAQGLAPGRVAAFPLGVDEEVRPDRYDRETCRRALGLTDEPTAIYVGALDRLRRLGFLIEVMGEVIRRVPRARLLVLGGARRPEEARWLEAVSARVGLGAAVRFLGTVPHHRVPEYLAAADVSVSPIPPLPIYVVSSPTKVVESLGMCRPVVGNCEIPDQRALIEESGGGATPPYRVAPFAAALVDLLADRSRACAAGERGRAYVIRRRSYQVLATGLEALYATLPATGLGVGPAA